MSILDKAKAHFSDRMSGGLRSVSIPEWDTTVFFKPSISLQQQAPISKLLAEGKNEEALVKTVIIRALDEDGKRLFREADKLELMTKCDPAIIANLVMEMNAGDNVDAEELGNG